MTDAHCHPRDLLEYLANAEEKRRESGTACAANSWNREQFEYHENLAKKAKEDGAAPLFCCFALHPQLSEFFLKSARAGEEAGAARHTAGGGTESGAGFSLEAGLDLLSSLAAEGRPDAVGETGFDLYEEKFKAAEKIQDEMFACHLEIALRYGLPVVLHVRRAMHKIFPFTRELKKLPAVIFHSWAGTVGEGESLLRRGINAFFSFGAGVVKNHKGAMASAALLPAGAILLETDAPYQPLPGKTFSSWQDLETICSGAAALRKEAGSPGATPEELEAITTANFYRAFSH